MRGTIKENPYIGVFPEARSIWYKHTDKFGRSLPKGKRRIFRGKRAHAGRPLPFSHSVRPQRATPTCHIVRGTEKAWPWYGMCLETLELLEAGRRVPGLLKATAKSNKKNIIYYTINLEYKTKNNTIRTRVVYKINKKDSCLAFGILEAIKRFTNRANLGLYEI